MTPLWDNDLLPGTGFSDQIQSFIINSHVLMPFITTASAERPWLHQEIGFAIALGKPVLPVILGGLPLGIISGIQAVQLREDLADAPIKLLAEYIRRLVDGMPDRPASYGVPGGQHSAGTTPGPLCRQRLSDPEVWAGASDGLPDDLSLAGPRGRRSRLEEVLPGYTG